MVLGEIWEVIEIGNRDRAFRGFKRQFENTYENLRCKFQYSKDKGVLLQPWNKARIDKADEFICALVPRIYMIANILEGVICISLN